MLECYDVLSNLIECLGSIDKTTDHTGNRRDAETESHVESKINVDWDESYCAKTASENGVAKGR